MSVSCPTTAGASRRLAVRLYLSSFRMGDHPEYLIALVGEDSRRTVVIANAMDDAPPEARRAGVEQELAALADLGFVSVGRPGVAQ